MAGDEQLMALRHMLNREVMAVEVYRRQNWRFRGWPEIARRLERAMDNEREHLADLRSRLAAIGGAPSHLGFIFYLFGALVLGFGPTLLGKRTTLKSNIWVERLAVKHYTHFLDNIAFDDQSRALLEKNRRDEERHIETWQDSLSLLGGTTGAAGKKGD